jgi:hypothetical protein
MTIHKDIFKKGNLVWDDTIHEYRRCTRFDIPTADRLFNMIIAPRCGVNGYQKISMDWPTRSSLAIEVEPNIDPFVQFLEWYFTSEVAAAIFDMAFGAVALDTNGWCSSWRSWQ